METSGCVRDAAGRFVDALEPAVVRIGTFGSEIA